MKNNLINHARNFFFGFACLAAASLAHSEEAYLGVNGYITSVPQCQIIETTSVSSFTNTASSVNKGFKIKTVQNNSPAQNAGLRSGDVIIEAEGIWINSYSSLTHMRRELAQNDQMILVYVRNGQVRTTQISGGSTTTTTAQ